MTAKVWEVRMKVTMRKDEDFDSTKLLKTDIVQELNNCWHSVETVEFIDIKESEVEED